MKKYERKQETPYLKKEIIENGTSDHRFISFFNDYMLSVSNILNLGIFSCSVYNKDYGLQIFDPFDLMFSKEKKKKLGLL